MNSVDATIIGLASGGDGIAKIGNEPVHIQGAIPGETWRLTLGMDRRGKPTVQQARCLGEKLSCAPICPHFDACGGCTLQHLPTEFYQSFKRERFRRAWAQHGLKPVDRVRIDSAEPYSRRRIRLGFERRKDATRLGYRASGSGRLVPIATCPIARPAINRIIKPLTIVLAELEGFSNEGDIQITEVEDTIDSLLLGRGDPSLHDRQCLSQWATQHGVGRIAHAETPNQRTASIIENTPIRLAFGDVSIPLLPNVFLQATAWGEARLRQFVERHTANTRHVLDLYSGFGALSIGLLRKGIRVTAIDASAESVETFERILPQVLGAQGSASRRNLDRDPVPAKDLDRYDAIILDPPRKGAREQIASLAQSRCPTIVYASCNPGTFARDAKMLIDAGYALGELEVIDQFLYSLELEMIAIFQKH